MKKYSKKIALILVLSLTLAFAIPALAADKQTQITGTYREPDIQVIIPGNTNAILNPYGLPVEIKNGSTSFGDLKNSQIAPATPLVGCNLSSSDLHVGAKVKGTPTGVTLLTAAPDSESTEKAGLIWFEVKASTTDLAYTDTPDTTCIGCFDGTKVVTEFNNWSKGAFSDEGTPSQILVSSTEASKNRMAKITKREAVNKPSETGYFIARVNGTLVKAPATAWEMTDKVVVDITWVFEPAQ